MKRYQSRVRRLFVESLESRTLFDAGGVSGLLEEAGAEIAPLAAAAVPAFERWTITATNRTQTSQGDPITLRWSFAKEGTPIPGFRGEAAGGSNLIRFLDQTRGAGPGGADLTRRPWFNVFANSFARWSALSGVTYVYEPNDDGAAFRDTFVTTTIDGVAGVRGDIRIGGHPIVTAQNDLAYNFFPNLGEMVISTDETQLWADTTNGSLALRNLITHEAGHGLGLKHVRSSDAGILMEDRLGTDFDGPQLDDILEIQRRYGDALEKGAGNNTTATATNLGRLTAGAALRRGTQGDSAVVAPNAVDFVSIDDESDVDFYKFTVAANTPVTLTLTPRGPTYRRAPENGAEATFNAKAQSNLTLQLIGTNGTTVLRTAAATGLGGTETIMTTLAAGTYYAKVSGATADKIQLYGLDVATAGASRDIVVNSVTADGGNQLTFNYTISGSAATAFRVGVYLSDDAVFNTGDSLVSTVNISSAADLAVGTHTKTWTIGTNILLPGAGAADAFADRRLLFVADDLNAVAETDATPFAEDNTRVFRGVYHVVGGEVEAWGGDAAERITVTTSGTNFVLDFAGTSYTKAATGVRGFVIRGAGGDDAINAANVATSVVLLGGRGNDTLTGGSAYNIFDGGNDNAGLGAADNDTLIGGIGVDFYRRDEDNWQGADTITDAGGSDTIDFRATSASFGVTINLGLVSQQQVSARGKLTLQSATAIENVFGGSGNDSLTGNTLANRILGNAGNDTLVGGAGDDRLEGGDGNDLYLFAALAALGKDTLVDTSGTDTISLAGTAADSLLRLDVTTVQQVNPFLQLVLFNAAMFENATGGNGNDTLTGNALNNVLIGGAGNDTLNGGAGTDTANGGTGTDTQTGCEIVTNVP